MPNTKRKSIVVISSIIFMFLLMYVAAYPTLYYYYLWRLNSTSEGGEIILIMEKVEKIAPHIIPLLAKTYENSKASDTSRGAAASGLIKADREKAEALFIKYLDNKDSNVLSLAIVHLGTIKSNKAFENVIKLIDSPNEDVRLAVIYYLGSIKNEKSISKLQCLMKNDASKRIRDSATYGLQRLGVISSN